MADRICSDQKNYEIAKTIVGTVQLHHKRLRPRVRMLHFLVQLAVFQQMSVLALRHEVRASGRTRQPSAGCPFPILPLRN